MVSVQPLVSEGVNPGNHHFVIVSEKCEVVISAGMVSLGTWVWFGQGKVPYPYCVMVEGVVCVSLFHSCVSSDSGLGRRFYRFGFLGLLGRL